MMMVARCCSIEHRHKASSHHHTIMAQHRTCKSKTKQDRGQVKNWGPKHIFEKTPFLEWQIAEANKSNVTMQGHNAAMMNTRDTDNPPTKHSQTIIHQPAKTERLMYDDEQIKGYGLQTTLSFQHPLRIPYKSAMHHIMNFVTNPI